MLKNYILVSIRNMSREKIYASLNIVGLAVGIACVLVIYSYVRFELSYDKFHINHQNIYRVTEEFEDDALRVRSAMSHAPLGDILSDNLAGLKAVVRIYPQSAFISIDKQTKYRESRFCFVDSLFFGTFTFQTINGSLNHALDDPFSVVLTKSTALKYFGDTNIVGKELIYEDETKSYSYNVTAVIKDVPQNSHFNFNFIASFSTLEKFMPWYNNWHYPAMYVYLQMNEYSSFEKLKNTITSLIDKHQPDYVKEEKRAFVIQPLTDIHLHSNLEFEWEANSNAKYLNTFSLLGIFILVIAGINFMNLATAQAAKRSREIGVRKVLGGYRAQLVWQFLSETLAYVLIAFIVSLLLTELSLRFILQGIIQKNLTVFDLLDWPHALLCVTFILLVSLLAGLYPAFYLSGFRPSQVIKGALKPEGKTDFRKSLVTFQFIVSCLMISATVIVSSQINYLRNKHLGFDKEHIITISLTDRHSQGNYTVLKEKLLAESGVLSVGLSSALPGKGTFHGFEVKPEGSDPEKEISIKTLGVDEDFLKTYGINVAEGRDFSKDILTDQTGAFILNKAAALKFGWANPVGKDFELTVYINGAIQRKGKVIGLIDDFNFQSLHNQVEPLVLYINKHPYYAEHLSVRMQSGNLAGSVGIIQKSWKEFHPDKPLEYQFLNDDLNKLYGFEMKISSIFSSLTIIAMIISVLGLFGLSSFMASKRSKEMGIRKVFGANVRQLLSIQFREYLYMILIANAIVIPLCWYWATYWLDNFAYHVTIQPIMFMITLVGSLLLAVVTVSFHSIKVARNNPIDTIRYE
ncbi:MAG: ABC transporter permease [Flammeovirgaceae bacterium]|nr:ABC transporter permease [Flammeovirgaceae bacterium]